MTKVLHVLTKERDALVREVISRHQQDPDLHPEVVDLDIGRPDYPGLLEKIFEADSVAIW